MHRLPLIEQLDEYATRHPEEAAIIGDFRAFVRAEPEHLHYDVRYLLRANGSAEYTVSDESHDLRWADVRHSEKTPRYQLPD